MRAEDAKVGMRVVCIGSDGVVKKVGGFDLLLTFVDRDMGEGWWDAKDCEPAELPMPADLRLALEEVLSLEQKETDRRGFQLSSWATEQIRAALGQDDEEEG